MVAAQRHAGLVVDKATLAFWAALDVAAIAADDDRGSAAAVDHEDRALARRKGAQRGRQRSREEAAIPGGKLGAQIHDLDARRRAGRPFGQNGVPICALADAADTLNGRRRTPEHDGRAGETGKAKGSVTCLESRRAIALVGGVVLLVDDDQPDVGQGRGQRRPGPDHDVDFTGADAPPLVGPLAFSEARMEHRDLRIQFSAKAINEWHRQRDLRDEDESRPAG